MSTLALSVTKTWGNRALDVNDPAWKALKQKVTKRDLSRCRFCNYKASKYMVLDHIDGDASNNDLSNLMLNCGACDKIRHCGLAGMKGFLVLCESNVQQVEIVVRSREFFRKHDRNPKPHEIAPDAMISSMRVTDLANKLKRTNDPEAVRGNLKGFFTEQFNNWQLEWEIFEQASLFGNSHTENPCTTFGGDGWLRAHYPGAAEVDLRHTGKWLLFIPCSVANSAWTLIKESTVQGLLGISAKIARQDQTSQPKVRGSSGLEHVVCIYTKDWKDHADVLRVAKALVEIGVGDLQASRSLYYKADEQTRRNISGSIYQFEPPYQQLQPTYGLTQWARLAEDAKAVLSTLHDYGQEKIQ